MLIYLRRLLAAISVLGCGLAFAPLAFANLTLGATSVISDGNLTLDGGASAAIVLSAATSTAKIGIGNTNPQALLHLGTAGTRAGIMKMDGATSGTITIQPAAAAGTWTFTLPTSAGTNGQILTTDGSGVTSWTTVAGGSFPLLAPNGSQSAPSYSFTNSTGSGMTYQGGNGVVFTAVDTTASGFLFNLKSPVDSTLEFQLGCTYLSAGCGMSFIPSGVTPAGVVKRWHLATFNPTEAAWPNVMQFQHEAATPSPSFIIPQTGNPNTFIIPCTGGTAGGDCLANDGPVLFLDGAGTQGTDGLTIGNTIGTVTFGGISVNDTGQIKTIKTGAGNGGVCLNNILCANNSNNDNTSLGGVEIALPNNPGNATGFVKIRTNDATCLAGVGCISLGPTNSAGRANITASHANGLDFQQTNATGTTQNSFRMNSTGFFLGSGGFGTYQWAVKSAGLEAQSQGIHINQSAASSDIAGTISLSAATSGTKTFTTNYGSAPVCQITPTSDLGSGVRFWVTTTTSTVVANTSASATATFNYQCTGNPN